MVREGPAPAPGPRNRGTAPRVSRLMALALRMDELLAEGMVADQAELARLAHVTRPRVTQIMNLLHLAPDIQEAVLHLPLTVRGPFSASAAVATASALFFSRSTMAPRSCSTCFCTVACSSARASSNSRLSRRRFASSF